MENTQSQLFEELWVYPQKLPQQLLLADSCLGIIRDHVFE